MGGPSVWWKKHFCAGLTAIRIRKSMISLGRGLRGTLSDAISNVVLVSIWGLFCSIVQCETSGIEALVRVTPLLSSTSSIWSRAHWPFAAGPCYVMGGASCHSWLGNLGFECCQSGCFLASILAATEKKVNTSFFSYSWGNGLAWLYKVLGTAGAQQAWQAE